MEYKSRGTVRVESIRHRKLIFVPDDNHSVKDGNNEYAAFFDSGEDPFNRGRIVYVDANRGGISVALGGPFQNNQNNYSLAIQLLSSAVAKRMKVEITVEIPGAADDADGADGVILVDIALPAT